jgi:primosomal protein N'
VTAICSENLILGVAIMSTASSGYEPSHGCRACGIPLWLVWSFDDMPFAACPHCGEEAEQIRYCPSCDRPGCRNPGC